MTKINSKQCTKCDEVKAPTEFYRNKGTKDGLLTYCKVCQDKYVNEHRGKIRGSIEAKSSQAVRKSRQTAKRYGAVDTLTLAEVREIFSADHCDYCDKHLEQADKTLEHVIPFEYGGENAFGNVTLACRKCNEKKSTNPAFEFILLNGDANAARRLLYTLAERNGIEPQDYLYALAQAGIQYRTARLYRIVGVEQ